MRNSRKILVLATVSYALSACATGEQIRFSRPPASSARDAYAGSLAAGADAAAVRAWEEAGRRALRSGLSIPASFHERVRFPATEAHAVAYRFTLREGQRLHIRHQPLDGAGPLFTEVFQDLGGELFRPADAAGRGARSMTFTARTTGEFVLRMQPELGGGGLYEISVEGDVAMIFPVANAGLRDIRSVFGDPRDGGRRRHEGVDIFAPRGTPVIAVTSGRVSRVSNDNIGGRVVWLEDDASGLSYYYAHLDQQHVRTGQYVQAGEVLGTVGNTGNARGTPPHLHFGVYRPGRVAIDPQPLLNAPVTGPTIYAEVDPAVLGRWSRTTDYVRLRASPSFGAQVVAELQAATPIFVLGGVSEWRRVLLEDGRSGFVAAESMQ